jgi:hypothetical protein
MTLRKYLQSSIITDATIVDFGVLDCVNAHKALMPVDHHGPGMISKDRSRVLADGNENTLNPTIDEPGNYVLTITNTLTVVSRQISDGD